MLQSSHIILLFLMGSLTFASHAFARDDGTAIGDVVALLL